MAVKLHALAISAMLNLIAMIPQKQLLDNSEIEGEFLSNEDASFKQIEEQLQAFTTTNERNYKTAREDSENEVEIWPHQNKPEEHIIYYHTNANFQHFLEKQETYETHKNKKIEKKLLLQQYELQSKVPFKPNIDKKSRFLAGKLNQTMKDRLYRHTSISIDNRFKPMTEQKGQKPLYTTGKRNISLFKSTSLSPIPSCFYRTKPVFSPSLVTHPPHIIPQSKAKAEEKFIREFESAIENLELPYQLNYNQVKDLMTYLSFITHTKQSQQALVDIFNRYKKFDEFMDSFDLCKVLMNVNGGNFDHQISVANYIELANNRVNRKKAIRLSESLTSFKPVISDTSEKIASKKNPTNESIIVKFDRIQKEKNEAMHTRIIEKANGELGKCTFSPCVKSPHSMSKKMSLEKINELAKCKVRTEKSKEEFELEKNVNELKFKPMIHTNPNRKPTNHIKGSEQVVKRLETARNERNRIVKYKSLRNSSNSSARVPYMVIDVSITNNKRENIKFFSGDNPIKTTKDFAVHHGIYLL